MKLYLSVNIFTFLPYGVLTLEIYTTEFLTYGLIKEFNETINLMPEIFGKY